MEQEKHLGAGLAAGYRAGFARGPRGKRLAALILDDAHHLAPEVVIQFRRWRTAFQSVRGPLSVILTATSDAEVADISGSANVSTGAGSKDAIIWLRPFNRNDVQQLINHRLQVAGYRGPSLFSPEAITRIFDHAKGNPSRTMRLCRRAVELAADDCGSASVAEIDAAARIALMSEPNLKRNNILRRTFAVSLASMPGLPPAPAMPAHVRRVDKKLTASEPSGRSSPAFRGRKALRARLLHFASATTSMVTVFAIGWFYIAERDAAVHSIAAIETTIPTGKAAAMTSVQPGGDQGATDLPGDVASPVDDPLNDVIEVLPRKAETLGMPDLDQVVVTDMSAAGGQQLPFATSREFAAVDPEPPEVKTAPPVEDLLDHGNRLLELGDVAAARLFYGMAAERGSAEGALLMGVTFDPVYFERHGIRGTRPHVLEAVNWYEKAEALGSPAAEERKNALASRLRSTAHDGDEDARHALKLFFEPAPQ
jgi:hypothetical protein